MCGCDKIIYLDDGIEGMDETDMKLMGGAVAGYIATAYVDNSLVYEKDGTKKTGKLAEDDNLRNGLYVAGGIGLNWMWGNDPLVKGGGIGMAIFGAKELIKKQYPKSNIKGLNQDGSQKYIAGMEDRYIGSATSRRIDLNLERQPIHQMQAQPTEQVVITNNYA